MNGVGLEILAGTPVPQLPPFTTRPHPPHAYISYHIYLSNGTEMPSEQCRRGSNATERGI